MELDEIHESRKTILIAKGKNTVHVNEKSTNKNACVRAETIGA